MDLPTCKTCIHWRGRESLAPHLADCRAGLPVIAPATIDAAMPDRGWWPVTHESEGCGNHPDFWMALRQRNKENQGG